MFRDMGKQASRSTRLKNVFVNLSCSFNASSFHDSRAVCLGEKRVTQYVEGFKSFFGYCKKYFNSYKNVFIVDNTLKDISFLARALGY